jgi:hypothetical protein
MDPVATSAITGAIGATVTIVQTWLTGRVQRSNDLGPGRVYRLPPGGQVRRLGDRWVVIEVDGQASGRDGLPNERR